MCNIGYILACYITQKINVTRCLLPHKESNGFLEKLTLPKILLKSRAVIGKRKRDYENWTLLKKVWENEQKKLKPSFAQKAQYKKNYIVAHKLLDVQEDNKEHE
jgi:hypothetical protein